MDRERRYKRTVYDARQSRRAKHIRAIRLKKLGALSILILMFLAACGVLFGIGFGIYKLVTSRKMVEEPYSADRNTNIVLVENVYANTELTGGPDPDQPDPIFVEVFGNNENETSEGSTGEGSAQTQLGSKNKLIVVDAGHGGKDGGAIGVDNLLEKDCNLAISLYVRDNLLEKGYQVYMSRSDDTFIPLNTRASKANELGADAFVSVHMNSFPDVNSVSGVEAWTFKRDGCEELGQFLVDKVSEATGAKNRGVSFAKNLVVTSKTEMPAVIIECGYITNPDEGNKMKTDEYRKIIADAIAEAVDLFIMSREPQNPPEDDENSEAAESQENAGP